MGAFHEDYINIILDGIMNAGEGGSGCYIKNASGTNIISGDPWIGLLTADWTSSINMSTSEVTGGSYARQQAEFSASARGTTDNDSNIDFTSMPAVTVHAVAICATTTENADDAIIGGNLTAEKTCNSGDTFRIAAGDLDVTLT